MNGHLATHFHLSRNCLYCQSSLTSAILPHIWLGGLAAGGEDFQPHIAARFGRFAVLLGRHRPPRLGRMIASRPGKMPTTSVRLRTSFLTEALLRVVASYV